MKYTNVTTSFGVELATGTQLADFTGNEVTALKQLATEHGIVVFRGQNMDRQGQAKFGHRLGQLMSSPSNKPDIPEELIIIRAGPKSKAVAGQGGHSDVSSEAVPPDCLCCEWKLFRLAAETPSSQTFIRPSKHFRLLCRFF